VHLVGFIIRRTVNVVRCCRMY